MQGIRFEVSNPGERLSQARMAAWQDAQNKAQQLADLAGASLGQRNGTQRRRRRKQHATQ